MGYILSLQSSDADIPDTAGYDAVMNEKMQAMILDTHKTPRE
jgi:hypothetical protein